MMKGISELKGVIRWYLILEVNLEGEVCVMYVETSNDVAVRVNISVDFR